MPPSSSTRADRKLVVAMDTIVEGVHFPVDTDAADIGYRALAVNLSDLAAMGAEPAWMTLSLSLPQATSVAAWISRRVVRARGSARRRAGRRRHGARPSRHHSADRGLGRSRSLADALRCESRAICCSFPACRAKRLRVLQSSSRSIARDGAAVHLQQRFLRPEPRIALGRAAADDCHRRDGCFRWLADRSRQAVRRQRLRAQLNVDALPRSAAMRELFDADACLDYALAGGDDYEMLFTRRARSRVCLVRTCMRIQP